MSVYGLRSVWSFIKVPKIGQTIIQIAAAVGCFVWMSSLLEFLPKVAGYSPKSAAVAYVLGAAVVLLFAAYVAIYKAKNLTGRCRDTGFDGVNDRIKSVWRCSGCRAGIEAFRI